MDLKSIKQYFELLSLSGLEHVFINKSIDHPEVDKKNLIDSLKDKYKNCQKCPLSQGRINFVYGDGNPSARLMLIGEGPGAEENRTGHVFVGKAGQLLNKMLQAIKIKREDIYICNIVKCRPPGNRDPLPNEVNSCIPYLMEQIKIIKPEVILLLGRVAAQTLLNTNQSLTEMRKLDHEFSGIRTFVSYHPAALLRNPQWKKPAWIDLQRLQAFYDNSK